MSQRGPRGQDMKAGIDLSRPWIIDIGAKIPEIMVTLNNCNLRMSVVMP